MSFGSHCVSGSASRRFIAIVGLVAGAAVGLHGDRFRPGRGATEDIASTHVARAAVSSPDSLSSLDAATRQSIFEAMRVARATADRQIHFTNPEQQLNATIGPAGATIVGRDGTQVRFTGASLGRRQADSSAAQATMPTSDASVEGAGTARATLARTANGIAVTEWWTNTAAGIEQGFTIAQRPAGTGVLALEQRIDTDLTVQVSGDGSTALLSEGNQVRLQFEHLRAWDADGRDLPARLEVRGDTLAMVVDDTHARYPVTIDPTWTQEAYLKASNTGVNDVFGHAVAISGNTLVVGAWGESSNAVGVNGNQASNTASQSGAVYVFVRTGSTWAQQAYLKASNTGTSDQFGTAVAVSGDTIVVGAPGEDSNATGVDGNQADDSASSAGAAYVFVRTGTTWTQQAYLKASNTGIDDTFGSSVAVSEDTVVVGASGEDSNAVGVNGNQADNSESDSGAAYVFVRAGSTWTQQAYLKASNSRADLLFAQAVAVSGDTIVAGGTQDNSNATGVNGNQFDISMFSAGAAYVFVRTGSTWTQQAYLKASNTGSFDVFGADVAVSGDTVVVGAPGEGSNATGVNSNQADNSASNAGAAYVFVRTGTTWTQQAYLKASNTAFNDQFGLEVAIAGDTVVVGAHLEDSNTTGIDGNQADNSASGSGAAYVFVRTGTTWAQQAYLKASNTGSEDRFGIGVAVSGNTIVVGADFEDSSATGVNSTQANNSASSAGAVYVFVVPFVVDPPLVDLNGDGNGDTFVYRPSNGQWVQLFTAAGGGVAEIAGGTDPGRSVLSGDFDGDSLTDFFFSSSTTGEWLRLHNSGAGFTIQAAGAWWPGWQKFVLDLNGDGISDVFLYDPVSGQWYKCITTANDFIYHQGAWNPGWDITPLRLNADSIDDLFLINRATGRWFWVFGQPGGSFTYPLEGIWYPSWKIYPGDFNGDGLSDLLLHEPSNGQYYVALNTGNGFTYQNGVWALGWTPYVIDLDGNGAADLFLHNKTSGQWYQELGDGAGRFSDAAWGTWIPGWDVYPTDFNNDDRTDLLLYNPQTGQWYQAWNFSIGNFAYYGGTWVSGLTIVVGSPLR